jgi:hypothetical protein
MYVTRDTHGACMSMYVTHVHTWQLGQDPASWCEVEKKMEGERERGSGKLCEWCVCEWCVCVCVCACACACVVCVYHSRTHSLSLTDTTRWACLAPLETARSLLSGTDMFSLC